MYKIRLENVGAKAVYKTIHVDTSDINAAVVEAFVSIRDILPDGVVFVLHCFNQDININFGGRNIGHLSIEEC